MHPLLALDQALFRFINRGLANPFFDIFMPFVSDPPFFVPIAITLLAIAAIRGRFQTRAMVLMTVIWAVVINSVLVDWLKELIQRPRPFLAIEDVRLLVGRGGSYSMPSGHAASTMAVAAVLWWYTKRLWKVIWAVSVLVGFSRIYNGVHYPFDVFIGFAIGWLIGWGGCWSTQQAWSLIGPKLFPSRFNACPWILGSERVSKHLSLSRWFAGCNRYGRRWTYLALGLLLLVFVARLVYIGSGVIQLSKDEAYQWLWAKHLDWAYFSKPPMIAWLQYIGTLLFGDTEFGIRFFAPLMNLLTGALWFAFCRQIGDAVAGFFLVLGTLACPLLAAGGVLFTVDVPLVLFGSATILWFWRAASANRWTDWLGTGLCLLLAMLSKFSAIYIVVCWVLYAVCTQNGRRVLKRPGFYVSVGIGLLGFLPVVLWNATHDWATAKHLAERAGLDQPWGIKTRYLIDFLAAQLGLVNPFFFLASAVAVYKTAKTLSEDKPAKYLLWIGLPIWLGHLAYSLVSRVQPNWVVLAWPPLLAVTALWAANNWNEVPRFLRALLIAGLLIGIPATALMHESNLIGKIIGRPLPPRADPLRRVRYWSDLAREVAERVQTHSKLTGRPTFAIGDHYGITALVTFYWPEAKKRVQVKAEPIVYRLWTARPKDQFFFWPSYERRVGQDAIFYSEADSPISPPVGLLKQFEDVVDLGLVKFQDQGRIMRQVQFFLCRGLLTPERWKRPCSEVLSSETGG